MGEISQITSTIPALSTADLIAIVPNLGAVILHSELLNDPTGVLTALTITTSCENGTRKYIVDSNLKFLRSLSLHNYGHPLERHLRFNPERLVYISDGSDRSRVRRRSS